MSNDSGELSPKLQLWIGYTFSFKVKAYEMYLIACMISKLESIEHNYLETCFIERLLILSKCFLTFQVVIIIVLSLLHNYYW